MESISIDKDYNKNLSINLEILLMKKLKTILDWKNSVKSGL